MKDMLPATSKRHFLRAVNARPPKYLKPEQIHIIIENAQKERYKLLFNLLWNTGARISEALAVKVEDIDWSMKQLRFITKKRGGKAERIIPISDALIAQLSVYINTYRLTYTDKLFDMSAQAAHMVLKDICRKQGLPAWIHLHTFRHSFAVNCLSQGMTINTLKEALGHANVENTMIYLKVFQPDVQMQFNRVAF
jgi:site-specific recombinase XerD